MQKILIISTGGTFNKVYNRLNGELYIDTQAQAIHAIAKHWLCILEVSTLIGKDSLDIDDTDREILYKHIQTSQYDKIIIVHGTDTMDKTAYYLTQRITDKTILLTGAMVPYSIDPVEATANLASAYGYLNALEKTGIFIAMNGMIGSYDKIKKNRKEGRFILV